MRHGIWYEVDFICTVFILFFLSSFSRSVIHLYLSFTFCVGFFTILIFLLSFHSLLRFFICVFFAYWVLHVFSTAVVKILDFCQQEKTATTRARSFLCPLIHTNHFERNTQQLCSLFVDFEWDHVCDWRIFCCCMHIPSCWMAQRAVQKCLSAPHEHTSFAREKKIQLKVNEINFTP